MRSERSGRRNSMARERIGRDRVGRDRIGRDRVVRSRIVQAGALLLAAGVSLGATTCRTNECPRHFEPVELPEFMFGLSQVPADGIAIAHEVGARYLRPTLSWRTVEPTVVAEGLTLDAVRSDPEGIRQWAATRDWSSFDQRLDEIADAGLVPVPIIGHGYTPTLPLLEGVPAAPDVLGREEYLARQYRFVRSVVERYDGDGIDDAPSGLRIELWQTENELNQAFFTAIFGWRHPAVLGAFGSAWQDWGYVTRILETLRLAVKDADPTALTTMNFHTDVHPGLNEAFANPGWIESIRHWRGLMDVVSFDAYPNYYRSTPPNGNAVGERAAIVKARACGRPVVVMETGYPTGPSEGGYDEAKQAQFIRDAFDSSVAAGVRGFFLFGARTSETHGVTITSYDLEQIDLLAGFFETGDANALLQYAFANLSYVQNQLAGVVQAVEGYWGLYRADGSEKAALQVMRDIGDDLPE